MRSLFKKLCINSKAAKTLAIKELLEKSLFSKENKLFGAKNLINHTNEVPEKMLLKQNKKMVLLCLIFLFN